MGARVVEGWRHLDNVASNADIQATFFDNGCREVQACKLLGSPGASIRGMSDSGILGADGIALDRSDQERVVGKPHCSGKQRQDCSFGVIEREPIPVVRKHPLSLGRLEIPGMVGGWMPTMADRPAGGMLPPTGLAPLSFSYPLRVAHVLLLTRRFTLSSVNANPPETSGNKLDHG